MTNSGSNEKKGKGFAGLNSMVSDVSENVEMFAKASPQKASRTEPPRSSPSSQPAKPEPQHAPAKSPATTGSGAWRLAWAIVGIVGLVIWIALSGAEDKSQSATPYSPSPDSSALASAAPPALTPPPALAGAPAPAPAPAPASIPDEQKPAVGRNNVLNVPQIRWCKREKIRVEAIARVINDAYEHEINRYNTRVEDYNSRCSEFRYRPSSMELVDRELAAEGESIATKAKTEWVRKSLGLDSSGQFAPQKPPAATIQTSPPAQESTASANSLSYEEKESIESACSVQKTLYGPAEYNKCLSSKLAALKAGPRNIDLSALSYQEKESIESACSVQKTLHGPAEYNKCLSRKLAALKGGPRNIDLSGLSYQEKESIESACSVQKTLHGPAEYNKCLSGKLAALKAGPRNIDLSGLSYEETESIESACSVQKTLYGPAEYNKCLAQKLSQLRR